MNKADLVESVQKTLGKETSKALAERAVDAVVEGIKVGLKRGKTVQLVGFGTFKVVQRKARTGVNPRLVKRSKSRPRKT
jgi:nucleoid DNA-binding protein